MEDAIEDLRPNKQCIKCFYGHGLSFCVLSKNYDPTARRLNARELIKLSLPLYDELIKIHSMCSREHRGDIGEAVCFGCHELMVMTIENHFNNTNTGLQPAVFIFSIVYYILQMNQLWYSCRSDCIKFQDRNVITHEMLHELI